MRAAHWVLAGCLAAWASPCVLADDDPLTDDTVTVKTEGSHRLLLPKDWPVQQQDGLLAPAPVEEYLSMKFGQVRTKFAGVDGRLDELERRMAELAQQQRELLKGLKRLEEQAAAAQRKDRTASAPTP